MSTMIFRPVRPQSPGGPTDDEVAGEVDEILGGFAYRMPEVMTAAAKKLFLRRGILIGFHPVLVIRCVWPHRFHFPL